MSALRETPGHARQRQAAQAEVRRILQQSKAFNALSPQRQARVMDDTDRVVGFIADAGGSEALGMAVPGAVQATARPLAEGGPGGEERRTRFGQAGEDLANVVRKVDFPGFVADLIKGVFNAVVDASIQQMEAYAELVANVAKDVDEYMKDNVSEEAGRDYLVSQYPDHIEPDLEAGRVVPKRDADADTAPNFLQDLGIPFDFDDLDDEEAEKELVTAARKKMSMDRQQLLATMVMMGLNRIVVTDGSIRAGVKFDLNVEELAKRHFDRQTSFDYHAEKSGRKKSFWGTSSSKYKSALDISTDTNFESDNERSQEMGVKMTGNVDLRFKSDYFPLERMVELMGVNREAIESSARQGAPQRSAAQQPAPPAVPIPPLPGA